MTWLFPEPELSPGEAIEWKTKAQLMPGRGGHQIAGFLYLTNRHLFFVPGRGTPRARYILVRFARGDCTGVIREEGRHFGYGPDSSGGVWKRMRLSFSDGQSEAFLVRRVDAKVDFLRQSLRLAHS
jgi:hypothetical protein